MSRRFRVALAAILAAAALIRVSHLDDFSYGLDEILQSFWIHGDWNFFWKSLRFDAFHPPLDYMIDKLLADRGLSDSALKILPVLWGLGTIAAAAILMRRRAGEAEGLVAAALLAVSPFHVRYSQELRPYSLGLFALVLALLCLDRYLERPTPLRLGLLYVASLATAYALYLAAAVLAAAALAMLLEDAFAPDLGRRRAARRFLLGSPVFVTALWLGYLPWWKVAVEASSRPPMAAEAPLDLARAARILSFFAFAPDDGHRLGSAGAFFVLLAAAGLVIAARRAGLRFVFVWAIVGFAGIEVLGQWHPHYDFARRFLPAGLALPLAAAIALAALWRSRPARSLGAVALAAVLTLEVSGMIRYFRQGRADWRTLASHLGRVAPAPERVFTENAYAQLCLSYYLVGPDWLYHAMEKVAPPARDVANLEGEIVRLTWAWKPEQRAWLVLAGEPKHAELRRWASRFPASAFPRAEGAVLHRLDPEAREAALAAR